VDREDDQGGAEEKAAVGDHVFEARGGAGHDDCFAGETQVRWQGWDWSLEELHFSYASVVLRECFSVFLDEKKVIGRAVGMWRLCFTYYELKSEGECGVGAMMFRTLRWME